MRWQSGGGVNQAINAMDPGRWGGAACANGSEHAERVLHEPMNRRLSRLEEPPRRWYAAGEATRLGHGGVRQVAAITGLNEQPIRRGQQEGAGSLADVPRTRQRRAGGGRPRVEKGIPRCSRPVRGEASPSWRATR